MSEFPYQISQNPIYFGYLLITSGAAVLLSSFAALLAPAVFFVVIDAFVVPFEERRLQEVFGTDYEKYRKKVKQWI